MPSVKKVLPVLFFAGLFVFVVYQITPPASFTSASIFQMGIFFLPLLLFLVFLLNFFLNFFLRSVIFGVGLIILLILKGLDALNPVSFGLTVIAIFLLSRSLRKPKSKPTQNNIPKLSRLVKQR